MKIKNLSLKDFAIFVSDYLSKKEIDTVLSGGACVTIYTNNKYTSYDLDFVLASSDDQEKVEPIKETAEIKKGGRTLKLLSVTDCVKDRLAAYYHWGDRQALEQAVLVCRANPVDFNEVERWSENEGVGEKFRMFQEYLKKE
jgi:hypothetical protein